MKVVSEDISSSQILHNMAESLFMEADDGLMVPVKSVDGLENTNIADFRVRSAKDVLGRVIGSLKSASGEVNDEDSEFSGYTSETITGVTASNIAGELEDAVNQNKLRSADDGDMTRYWAEDLPDYQIFVTKQEKDDDGNPKGNPVEVIVVIRPLKIKREVTIVI